MCSVVIAWGVSDTLVAATSIHVGVTILLVIAIVRVRERLARLEGRMNGREHDK